MNKRIRTRLIVIVLLAVLSVDLFAGFPPRTSHMKDRIRLGLDLKGGNQLILQVVTDDAVRAETDQATEALRSRLQKENIAFRQILRTGTDRFVVTGIDAAHRSLFLNAIADELKDWEVHPSPTEHMYTALLKTSRAAIIRSQTFDQTMNTIRNRIDKFGVAEPTIQKYGESGSDQMLVQLPGREDTDRAKAIIETTALLELKLVDAGSFPSASAAAVNYGGSIPPNLELHRLERRHTTSPAFFTTQNHASITGRDLKSAFASRDANGHPAVTFSLTAEGARRFAELTEQNIGKRLAVVLDGIIQSAPEIHMRISDSGIIEGGAAGLAPEDAQDLALVLRSGALPASIRNIGEEIIGPSLGADSIRAGVRAAVIALAAVAVFMPFYYRMAGINAIIAMILNIALLLGAIAYFGITLTLPGIAGVTLTIGVGIDSNVLIFERIREELRAGKAAASAVATGFNRVFVTLVDTHLAALLSAAFLFLFGTGPIKGFAVALVIGLVSNMFTAVFVSRTLFEWSLARQGAAAKISI
jgi:preprotein translocase subunit SecD